MKPTHPVSQEKISQRAHQIWEQMGRPDGNDTEHWLQAERELHGQHDGTDHGSSRPSVEPDPKGKQTPKNTPHSSDYAPPGVTTDALHHRRKG